MRVGNIFQGYRWYDQDVPVIWKKRLSYSIQKRFLMRHAKSYSIWLIPPKGNLQIRLSDYISELAEIWIGPTFVPHVTLVGGVPGDESDFHARFEKVVFNLRTFVIYLKELEQTEEFFRSFYVRVDKSRELMLSRQISGRYFGLEDDPFNPHLSLYYGYKSTKEKTNFSKRIQLPEDEFTVNKLYFVHNNEEECKWTVLDERFLPACRGHIKTI